MEVFAKKSQAKMKKGLFFSFLYLIVLITRPIKSQILFKLENDSLSSYNYSGGDEFNGTKIDENYWTLLPWPKNNLEQFFAYDARNTEIQNGVAVFSMKEKDSVYKISSIEVDSSRIQKKGLKLANGLYRMKYTAGIIISKEKMHYSLYELRFKVEKGKGVWPSFWFCGGYKNEEIDAFELKGEKNDRVHVDTHCPYGCDNGYVNKLGLKTNWGDWVPIENYLHEGFNIFLLDWQADALIWYLNGYPIAYFKGSFKNPMNLYINTQVSSNYSAFQPGPDETTVFPNYFYVDYIRIWKKNTDDKKLILKPSDNFKVSNRFVSDYNNKTTKKRGLVYLRKKLKNEKGMISFNLSMDGKLIVTVLGALNNKSASVVLKGKNGDYTLSQQSNEHEINIVPSEKELELIVTIANKIYNRTITIE